ncbi:integrase core domain-containing protein [Elysia marginata]|uniref:Integrase core domain-containing protein n=1 Tax=Elysia marginata TaxID=1093978 RepID=A0AAV4F6X6_9GAST|nr:integrase core domain-containing protein [Elysia marginata]
MLQLQQQVPTKPIPDVKAESISALDKEMRGILEKEGISDYDKALKYRSALTRYINLVDNYKHQPIGRVELTEEKVRPQEGKEVISSEVIETLPKPLKKKGELLLKRLRNNSDLDWNGRGEIKYKSEWIRGSNLTDLVSEALRYKPREDKAFPKGWEQFQDLLVNENIPRKLLGASGSHSSGLRTEASPLPERSLRKKFQRRKFIVAGIDSQWQIDLVDLQKLKKFNKGFRYLFTCIDVFSKYAWAVPIKDKTGKATVTALKTIMLSGGRKPKDIVMDKGSEFLNRIFLQFLKSQSIRYFTTENAETKAAVIERWHRTLKNKMFRYFTKTMQYQYLNVLQDLVKSYNKSYHHSIKRSPVSVNRQNQEEVWQNLYGSSHTKIKNPKLRVGDTVRLVHARKVFNKGYLPNWTVETFRVKEVRKTVPITYVVIDYNGNDVKGTFYEEELQKIGSPQEYKIEKILRRSRDGKKLLVRWLGYGAEFDSWVNKRDLTESNE